MRAPRNPRLPDLHRDVLALVGDEWQGQRAIVFAFNGARETTIPEAQIVHALGDLVRRKLIEARGRKTRAGSGGGNAREFRRRTGGAA